MKKIISVILILVVIVSLVSCRKISDDTISNLSTAEIVDASLSDSSSAIETVEPEVQQIPQEQPSQNTLISTIATPKEVIFYKGGKYCVSTNQKLNLNVAKCVESWYKNYENDTLPLTKTAVSKEMIAKLMQNETVIEICFDYDQEINLLGKINLEHTYRLLIPLTGNQAYYVFRGNSAYIYKNGLHAVNGSGLEKYFNGVELDKDVKKWESTVIAPTKVTFYKEGMQSVSTDKEFNHIIARHIESWFQYEDSIAAAHLAATTDLINEIKRSEMAIELQFDSEIKFYGGVMSENTRTLFIPLTGDCDYLIFNNTLKYPNNWSGPKGTNGGSGLEKFFDKVQFAPITEENTKPTGQVFDTENIIRITFDGYYGKGTGVDVPNENMAKVIKWLGTFKYGERLFEKPKPGTNTHCVEIEYTDGTVMKQGLDVIIIDSISYKLEYGTCPECYWNLISKSTLPTKKQPPTD